MRVAIFGILPFSDLIKKGFEELGHEISNEDPELIFANDPTGYQDGLFLKQKYPSTNLILNVLDIPWHFPNIQKQFQVLVQRFFSKADFVTAISHKVKKDLEIFFEKKIYEKIKVIYNPTKDVYLDKKISKNNTFLFVGRANDPIKRFDLVRDSIQKIENGKNKIIICGNENPNFGNFLGYVSDKKLNELYNSTKYVLLPSKAEGIGLPMIEATICGSLPITCSDNLTAKEFLPKDFICEPDTQSIINFIKELENNYDSKRKLVLELGKKYKDQFNKTNIAKNILSIKK